jgi:hypothetical protein
MLVRVFAGWDFQAEDLARPDFAAEGYRRGVPMGGELRKPPSGASPTFLVRALRDPDGANLDRIQIIKGWLDAQGELHERVYDVALADEREVGPDGKAPPVGSTVNVESATYSNSIGDSALAAYWQDPTFDAAERAFYYVRVIEIPTPRWTAFDRRFFQVEMAPEIPMTTTERAYTSPIWYTPGP